MTFNSLEFAVFFAIVFFLYWFVTKKSLKLQNILLLVMSYVFYGWWDWRFLGLIFISSLCDYLVGIQLSKTENASRRKLLLYTSLAVNLGILGFFKYFNFFVESFIDAFNLFGGEAGFNPIYVILPVGISFYTLQTLSYSIDVYDKKLKPSKDIIEFFAYVSFFPQLVAGPIERATNLLPQFQKQRNFNYQEATDGMRQVLWGLFKKMVVADNIASYSDGIYYNYELHDASTLWIMLIFASFQFYCDFSGYSDIAIGTARMLGFNLMKNFDYPFFSRNLSEFWQKWHISLISWFRDYIVNRIKGRTRLKLVRNVFIIFIITGLWHGARWTYIIWALLHAVLFIPMVYGKRVKYRHSVAHGKTLPSLRETYLMIRVFLLFVAIGIFFRAENIQDGLNYFIGMFDVTTLFNIPELPGFRIILPVVALLIIEWLQREKDHGLDFNGRQIALPMRWGLYVSLVFIILAFGAKEQPFIYFQF